MNSSYSTTEKKEIFVDSPNNIISASANRANRRDILPRNLKEVAIDVVLNIAATMSGYPSDAMLS